MQFCANPGIPPNASNDAPERIRTSAPGVVRRSGNGGDRDHSTKT